MPSALLKLNWQDLGRGAVVAVLGALINSAYQAISTCQTFQCLAGFNWYEVLQAALFVGATYLIKNLLSTEDGKFLGAI